MPWSFQWFGSDMETVWNIWTVEDWVISVRRPVVGKHMSVKPAVRRTHETGVERSRRRRERTGEMSNKKKRIVNEMMWKETNKTKEMLNPLYIFFLSSCLTSPVNPRSLRATTSHVGWPVHRCLCEKLSIEQVIEVLALSSQAHTRRSGVYYLISCQQVLRDDDRWGAGVMCGRRQTNALMSLHEALVTMCSRSVNHCHHVRCLPCLLCIVQMTLTHREVIGE